MLDEKSNFTDNGIKESNLTLNAGHDIVDRQSPSKLMTVYSNNNTRQETKQRAHERSYKSAYSPKQQSNILFHRPYTFGSENVVDHRIDVMASAASTVANMTFNYPNFGYPIVNNPLLGANTIPVGYAYHPFYFNSTFNNFYTPSNRSKTVSLTY
jgi:hypothetical protein